MVGSNAGVPNGAPFGAQCWVVSTQAYQGRNSTRDGGPMGCSVGLCCCPPGRAKALQPRPHALARAMGGQDRNSLRCSGVALPWQLSLGVGLRKAPEPWLPPPPTSCPFPKHTNWGGLAMVRPPRQTHTWGGGAGSEAKQIGVSKKTMAYSNTEHLAIANHN